MQTKKVHTYGKSKTRVISLYQDVSDGPSSPMVATPVRRPALASTTRANIPTTPLATRGKGTKDAIELDDSSSSPLHVWSVTPVPRQTKRYGRKIVPDTPRSLEIESPLPAGPASVARQVIDSVEIISAPRRRPATPKPRRPFREVSIDAVEDDLDSSISRLRINDARLASPSILPNKPTAEPLEVLRLACRQTDVLSYTALFQAVGQLLPDLPEKRSASITKAGEATYSEVYAATSPVSDEMIILKIVPLALPGQTESSDTEMPQLSDPMDVAKELQITQRLSDIKGAGFIGYHG